MTTLNIKIEFGGGLELLFSNQRSHRISLPAHHRLAVASSRTTSPGDSGDSDTEAQPANMDFLIQWLKENLLKERAELFVENDTVRPGILVLINDTDWELEGEGQYELKEGDEVVFISTLHGGTLGQKPCADSSGEHGTCPRTDDVLTLTPYKYPSIQLSDCSIGEMQVISRAVGDGEEGGSADYTLYHIGMTRIVILFTVIYLSLCLN